MTSRCGWSVRRSGDNGSIVVRAAHAGPVHAVLTVTGEHVADLCETCGERLDFGWDCTDCTWIEVTTVGDASPRYVRGYPCPRHA